MDDAKWARVGALGGVLFIVVIVVSGILTGTPPAFDDPAQKFANYFADHDNQIQLSAYLDALALVPILFWLGALWRQMRIAENEQPRLALVAAAGLILGGSFGITSSALMGTTALQFKALDPESMKFFSSLSAALDGASAIGLATLVAAVSALVLRTEMFPRWLGWAGAVVALSGLGAGAEMASQRDAVIVVNGVAFTLFLAWVLVVSVLLFRAPGPATAATPEGAAAAPAAG